MDTEHKRATFELLRKLENKLNAQLRVGPETDAQIRQIVAKAKKDPKQKHKTGAEYAFINHFVLPALFNLVCDEAGLSAEQARSMLLSEFFRYTPDLSAGSPARGVRHPFNKQALNQGARRIMDRWKGLREKTALTQSCPDFALGGALQDCVRRQVLPKRIGGDGREKSCRKYLRSLSLSCAPEIAENEISCGLGL